MNYSLHRIILLIVVIAAVLSPTVEASSRRATPRSTWNPKSSSGGGLVTRKRSSPQSNLVTREATSDDSDNIIMDDNNQVDLVLGEVPVVAGNAPTPHSSVSSTTSATTEDMKMGPASARAAVVACVSAAAIGGARVALELVCA